MGYDEAGRNVATHDPDMGDWQHLYNAFGEIIAEKNGKGEWTFFTYDTLGRRINRLTPHEGMTVWIYDTAPNAIGDLHLVFGAEGVSKTFTYDLFGRPVTTHTQVGGEHYQSAFTYDLAGRLRSLQLPAHGMDVGLSVDYIYD